MTDEELRRLRLVLLCMAGALSLLATMVTLYLEYREGEHS